MFIFFFKQKTAYEMRISGWSSDVCSSDLDANSLERAAAEAGDDLAGVFVSAFKHDLGKPHERTTPAFAAAARLLCDRTGAALIVDDVRASFRLHMGGSWELVGVRPDLSAWSKSIANGYALAAVTGNDRFRDAAGRIFVTGSFWYSAVSMAASLATIAKMQAIGGLDLMQRMGPRPRAGIDAQPQDHGLKIGHGSRRDR